MADIFEQLALLTDAEIRNVLNRILEGYAARNPNVPIGDPEALDLLLKKAGEEFEQPIAPREDAKLGNRPRAERAVVVQLAGLPDQRPFVQGAIDNSRNVLIEPITTALVMAGIILVLQTQFDVKVSRKGGKTDYEIKVGKKPTDGSLIKKIFSIFS